MQVRHRLFLNSTLSVAAAFAFLLVLVISAYYISQAVEKRDFANRIIITVLERATLKSDYLQSGSERAKAQWYVKNGQVGLLLKSAFEKFHEPEDNATISELIEKNESIVQIVSALIENRENAMAQSNDGQIRAETEDRLRSQYNMRLYNVVLLCRELQDSGRIALISVLRMAGWGIGGVLALIMAAVIVNSSLMGRSITKRMKTLTWGAAMIGKGNLDHRIDIKGCDEFASLSDSLNDMTEKLQISYNDLEKEVSYRRHAEEELRQSEERFRLFMDNSPAITWIKDAQGRHVYLSKTYEKNFGVTLENCKGKTDIELWPPEIAKEFRDNDDAVLASGHVTEFYEDTKLPDGTVQTWWNFKIPFKDSAGLRYVAGIGTDVTERKRMEEALVASRNELQSIIDGTTSIVYAFDLEEKFLIANKALAALLNSTPEQIIGRRRHDFMPEETAEWHEANDRKVIEQGQALGFEEYGPVRKDGRLITWLTTKFPLRDSQGKIYAVAGISADITERKEYRDELELRVQERTAAVLKANDSLLAEIEERKRTERALRSAHKDLRAMESEVVLTEERSRHVFATDLHDTVVQTLAAAKLRSQLIQGQIPKKAKPIFGEMQNLLSDSIKQARSLMAEMSPPVLNELGLIPALEWLSEKIINEHKIEIRLVNKTKEMKLLPDVQVLIFRSIRELLLNVVKHAHAQIATVKVTQNGRNLNIEITDDGKGFDVKDTFSPGELGGFGLYGIRERLKHIGGQLAIKSELNKGTTVLMLVPLG